MRPLCLLPALVLTISAQDAGGRIDTQIQALTRAKDWNGLADYFETLTPRERGQRISAWLESLAKAERWAYLLQVCDAVLPQKPDEDTTHHVHHLRVKSLIQQKEHAQAVTACEGLGDAGQTYYLVLGTDQARIIQDWPSLERLGGKLLARNPKDPIGLAVHGEALARMDRFAEAEPILRDAVVANPKDGWVYVNLSRCLNARKAWADSVEACDRAMALDPKLTEARFNRGRACFELARYQEARDDFQAALSQLPGDPILQENLKQAQRYLDAVNKPKKAKK